MQRQIIVDSFMLYRMDAIEKRNWLGIFSIRNNYTQKLVLIYKCFSVFNLSTATHSSASFTRNTHCNGTKWLTTHTCSYANINLKSQINKYGASFCIASLFCLTPHAPKKHLTLFAKYSRWWMCVFVRKLYLCETGNRVPVWLHSVYHYVPSAINIFMAIHRFFLNGIICQITIECNLDKWWPPCHMCWCDPPIEQFIGHL